MRELMSTAWASDGISLSNSPDNHCPLLHFKRLHPSGWVINALTTAADAVAPLNKLWPEAHKCGQSVYPRV